MDTEKPVKPSIPQQDLKEFSLFRAEASAAQQWAQQLPVANTSAAAQQLLAAVSELNRCKLAPELRFNILEALAANLQVTLSNLPRRFLNQPLIMPEEPRQLAELTDNLQSQICTAYSIVAIETLQQRESIRGANPARLVCESIQHAMHYAGRSVLLTFQLYHPVTLGGWLTIHQLYALAERQGLAAMPVNTHDGKTTTIIATYLQALLLGCCKPNQLRQSDLAAVFSALGQWSEHLNIGPVGSFDGLFLVNLDSDQPPLYSSVYGSADNSNCRQISTESLVVYLQQLKDLDDTKGKPGIALDSGLTLPANMLSHMIDALGSMSMRNFNRVRLNTPLTVSIGLSAAHFHAAGRRSFGQLLYGDNYIPAPTDRVATNQFLQQSDSSRDAWSKANPEEDFVREHAASEVEAALTHRIDLDKNTQHAIEEYGPNLAEDPEIPIYLVELANASPGGYCLDWREELPATIRAGDIVSVQEDHSDNWAVAVIRWVSTLQDAHTLVGLELLSPRSKAYGAQIHKKTGHISEPQRVLLLPEIQLVGQPHTLITPRAGFRERQKISLLRQGEKFLVQLTRQVSATASYAQFDFRYIKQVDEVMAQDKSGPLDATYDSLWSNI